MSMPKKARRVRMCVDYCNLNKAFPKKDFPLAHINILADTTTRHALLSFMDRFFGYNKEKVVLKEKHKITFIRLCLLDLKMATQLNKKRL